MHLGSNNQLEARFFRSRVSPHHSGQRFAIRHRQRRISQLLRAHDQLIRMRRALQKRKIRFAM
jgi:hypothetical protein